MLLYLIVEKIVEKEQKRNAELTEKLEIEKSTNALIAKEKDELMQKFIVERSTLEKTLQTVKEQKEEIDLKMLEIKSLANDNSKLSVQVSNLQAEQTNKNKLVEKLEREKKCIREDLEKSMESLKNTLQQELIEKEKSFALEKGKILQEKEKSVQDLCKLAEKLKSLETTYSNISNLHATLSNEHAELKSKHIKDMETKAVSF